MTHSTQVPGPRISIIVAMARNRVIGASNQLPWHLSGDLKRFRALTMGHTIVMGRRTYESIGRPLPGRDNVVISRQSGLALPGVTVVASVDEATRRARTDEVFIIGGAEIYREALPKAQRILLTEIHGDFEGDTYFPDSGPGEWRESAREKHRDDPSGVAYDFVTLERKSHAI